MARFLFRFHFNIFGIVHLLERQFTYPVRKRGGEQHVEALIRRRHAAEQPADIFNKAQIVHTICFVQHDYLNGAEVNVVLLGVVNQTPRGANQNVNAAFQHFQLFVVAITTVSQTQLQAGSFRQRFRVGVDLHGKFTRRCHN